MIQRSALEDTNCHGDRERRIFSRQIKRGWNSPPFKRNSYCYYCYWFIDFYYCCSLGAKRGAA